MNQIRYVMSIEHKKFIFTSIMAIFNYGTRFKNRHRHGWGFVQSNQNFSNSGYPHLGTVEPTDEVNETKRSKKIDKLIPQSNNEIVTVNKAF